MLKIAQPTDYKDGKSLPQDLSNLNPTAIEVVPVGQGVYAHDQTYVSFGEGLVLEYKSQYLVGGDSVGSIAVWDPIKKEPVWFGLGYENMARDPKEILHADATPEVKAEYEAWKKAKEDERQAAIAADKAREKAEHEAFMATQPTKGKTVRVVRGQKVPIGLVGKVFWYGQVNANYSGSRWSRGATQTRVGIEVTDEVTGSTKVFTAASNVELVEEAK